MTVFFRTVLCPHCSQDYLLVTRNDDTKKLYLSCSECEASWNHPRDVSDPSRMFVQPDIDATDPSLEEIRDYGWEEYISGTLESQ